MATTLVIETYQVVAGVDASDPNPTILAPGFATREAADRHLAQLQTAVNEGDLVLAAPTLFVRATPGAQTMAVTEPATRTTLRADLIDKRTQVVVYVRLDENGTTTHKRLGSIAARAISGLAL